MYPTCRFTIDYDEHLTVETGHNKVAGVTETVSPNGLNQSTYSHIPRRISARSIARSLQTAFYQSTSLPKRTLDFVLEQEKSAPEFTSAFQWRLDFPHPVRPIADPTLRAVLSSAISFLGRGTATYCSTELEQALETREPPTAPARELLFSLAANPTCPLPECTLDSEEEYIFARWAASLIASQSLAWSLIPQVEINSFGIDTRSNTESRVDFVFIEPSGTTIVVEIDGEDHANHRDADSSRDRELTAAGVQVVRVSAEEVRNGEGHSLTTIGDILRKTPTVGDQTDYLHHLRVSKYAHQIQIVIIEALLGGWLSFGEEDQFVQILVPPLLGQTDVTAKALESAAQASAELINQYGRLYDASGEVSFKSVVVTEVSERRGIVIGPSSELVNAESVNSYYAISDIIFPRTIATDIPPAIPIDISNPDIAIVRWFLNYAFRKSDFWEGQWEGIRRILSGLDTVMLLPTGGGKSIVFQLAALLRAGICVVVDPIISLVDDQIDNLQRNGIDRAVGITGQLTQQERVIVQRAMASGYYKFVYVAPERFQMTEFRDALRAMTVGRPVALIAVDEAHCVSEWGHDFRTAYLNIGRTARDYCTSNLTTPPLVALTGTASKVVLKDVQRELSIKDFDAVITPRTFDRPELIFSVVTASSNQKIARVEGTINTLPSAFAITPTRLFEVAGQTTYAGLVFCPHVNGEYGVVQVSERLSRGMGTNVEFYSGSAPRNYDESAWNKRRQEIARKYRTNKIALMACTNAFGMGIDIPNIRYTVHIGLPESIESFYQEAGRAGRDKQTARCSIVVSNDDPERTRRLLDPSTEISTVAEIVESVDRSSADDVIRALWFHIQSFRGIPAENEDIRVVCAKLGDLTVRHTATLVWDERTGLSKQRLEKAIHRLVVVGAVRDYTVNYSPHEITVEVAGSNREEIIDAYSTYAGAYQVILGRREREQAGQVDSSSMSTFVVEVAALLVNFIYKHVELARRRALHEMLLATETSSNERLRSRMLDYLQKSAFDERLDQVLSGSNAGLDEIGAVVDEIASPREAEELRGAVSRALTSYPDQPSLLLLRAFTEALSSDSDQDVISENLDAAFKFSYSYGADEAALVGAIEALVITAEERGVASTGFLGSAASSAALNRSMARDLARRLDATPAYPFAVRLLANIANRLHKLNIERSAR